MARATKARGSAHAQAASPRVISALARLDLAIEACWLAAAVLVPLTVLPETSFISFTSVPKIAVLRVLAGAAAMLLAVRCALWAWSDPESLSVRRPFVAAARDWAASTPAHTVSIAVLAVLGATAISAAISLSPYLSVFGKDPGTDGYGLYDSACYATLGLAVATRLRRPVQVSRLLAAIAAAGCAAGLIALMQNWGFAPLDISATAGVRVTGTSGNPIFLGALLVLTLPVSLAAAALLGARLAYAPRWWAVTVPALAIQGAALALTLSRGPWSGAFVAVPVFVGLMWLTAGRKAATALGIAGVAAAVLAYIALSVPSWMSHAPASASQGVQQRVEDAVVSGSVMSRIATVDDELAQGLSGRMARWSTSARLALERPPVAEGSNPGRLTRFLAGYGPDMFRFAFPVRAPADFAGVRTDAAHNDHLNRLVELGVLGSVMYLAMAAAVVAAVAGLLRAARRTGHLAAGATAAGLAAAFAGRVIEQSFGIAKPGDLAVTWLLIGLAAAAPAAFALVPKRRLPAAPAVGPVALRTRAAGLRGGRTDRQGARALVPGLTGARAVAAVATVAVLALAVLTWTKGIGYLRADHLALRTVATFGSDPAAGLRQIEAAISLAPDVRDYHHRRSLMLQAAADADPARALPLLRKAVESDVRAVELNPMSIDSNMAAAYSSWRVAQSGDVEMALLTLTLYERLSYLTPQNALVRSRLESLRSMVRVTVS